MSAPALRAALAPLLAAAAVGFLADAARANEIVLRDPQTCATTTVRAVEILPETWVEVEFRERDRGPTRKVPLDLVVEIRRESAVGAERTLIAAIAELERGNVREAIRALSAAVAGGHKTNLESRVTEFIPYTQGDPPGRGRRPPWPSEYAHFYYAKALYLEGSARKDADTLEEALLALEDRKVLGREGKEVQSGGFLERFKGGNSRFLPEAMLLRAKALQALGRHADAAKAYDALYEQVLSAKLPVRWAFEAKLGPGSVAEARGEPTAAVTEYEKAMQAMAFLLREETRPCIRLEIGRYYSRARMRAALVKLEQARAAASPPAFQSLREYVEAGSPDALRRAFAARPPQEQEAIVAGAGDPEVQAISQNAYGLAYLHEGRFEEAVVAFRRVAVQYFQVPEQPALALYHLAEAADKAAAKVRGEAKALYATMKQEALETLRATYPDSPWAKR